MWRNVQTTGREDQPALLRTILLPASVSIQARPEPSLPQLAANEQESHGAQSPWIGFKYPIRTKVSIMLCTSASSTPRSLASSRG